MATVIRRDTRAWKIQVWISLEQFEYWSHTHITIDVVPGRGGGFSLETPEGLRFIIRSRLFTDDETAQLDGQKVILGSGIESAYASR